MLDPMPLLDQTTPSADDRPAEHARAMRRADPARERSGRRTATASAGQRVTAHERRDGTADPVPPELQPPPTPARHIDRPRLVRRLESTDEASVILLTASAGYGKSTLLSEWTQARGGRLAWLTLDARDDEPARLLERLEGALGYLAQTAADGRGGEAGFGRLASMVGLVDGPAVLVLDDVHHVRSDGAMEVIATVARASSSELRVAFASRTEPPTGLARLRASGRLLQLGGSDLEMTAYEARRLLTAAGLDLDEPDLERLVDYTEGWAAALHLAAISLRSRPDAGEDPVAVARASGEIAEYVVEEVLDPLPERSRELLVRTSILEQLCAGLCDAVLDRSGCGPELKRLAARSLILVPQHGAGWYRCHALVGDVLRAELDLGEPEAVDLHLRASAWFADHGDVDRALDHAVAAGDPRRAGELLWAHGTLYADGPENRLRRWLGGFSADQLARSPQLALAAGLYHLGRGDVQAAGRSARLADAARAADGAGERTVAVQAGAALVEAAGASDGAQPMAESAERARALLAERSALQPLASLLHGVALALLGEREQARETLEEAVHRSAGALAQVESHALTQLALLDIDDGRWEQAGDRAAMAAESLAAGELAQHPTAALTTAVCALVNSQAGVAHDAKRQLAAASRLLEELGDHAPWHEVQARVALARACVRLADVARARALLSQASRWARRMPRIESLIAALDAAWGEIDDVSAAALTGPGSLTLAELRVLRFLPSHLSFREIGERLHVSGNTVKTQAHAVYAKLGASSRSEAVARASALGLIEATIV